MCWSSFPILGCSAFDLRRLKAMTLRLADVLKPVPESVGHGMPTGERRLASRRASSFPYSRTQVLLLKNKKVTWFSMHPGIMIGRDRQEGV
jgi:hypothetical protein